MSSRMIDVGKVGHCTVGQVYSLYVRFWLYTGPRRTVPVNDGGEHR